MGKFDNRDKMPGHGSHENNAAVTFSGKTNFKNRKFSRSLPYFSDPLLVPRISQYLEDNKDKVYIDINDMVNELQSHYREYARRKRNVFRQSVQKAFSMVLQQYGLSQGSVEQDDEYVGSTDNSSSEVEECNISDNEDKSKSSANNQLISLYKPSSSSQTPSKHGQKYPSENAELIDLSSDDENLKGNNAEEGKGSSGDGVENNGIQQNHSQSGKEPQSNCLRPKNSVKSGAKAERGGSGSRKRKLRTFPDKIHPHLVSTKAKKPSFQEAKVTFADFGGNAKALEEVCKLILHIQHPELYKRIGLSSPRGFLLHGPPGCGKTLLASAIAGELEVYFFKVSAPELIGGVSGESEERIRELFENAVECAPCVLFIDEVDAITPNRQNAQKEMERRIVAQLLTCLDELNNQPNGDQVLVIGATNRPDALDPALRRAGRFDKEVCLGIPDLKAREQILRVVCKNLKMAPNFSYEEIAINTPGFVGADLLALTREAAMSAINRVFGALHYKLKNRCKSKGKRIKLDSKEPDGRTEDAGKEENDADDSVELDIIDAKSGEKEKATVNGREGEKERGSSPMDVEGNGEKTDPSTLTATTTTTTTTTTATATAATKEKDATAEKHDSDMDIAETVSEESVNGEAKDIEICKDESVRTVNSEDESEIEVLPENYDSGPPTLETLLSWLRDTPPLTPNELKNVYLTQEDFSHALRSVQPSAKREGFATVPDVTWDDIGSLSEVREELKMSILGPVKLRKQYEQLGLSAPSGILICGPPGCGKTLLAKAVANEAGINFISVKGPELLNMYVGESERAVRQCFQRARNSAPCVIFFDELDALCPKRSGSGENGASMRVVNQMLTEMDGVEERKEVYLMAATNRPDIVDPAVLRPGRLDKILYVGLPDANDRADILRAITKNGTRPKLSSQVKLEDVAKRSECSGYSGADLAALVREAGVQALKDLLAMADADGQKDVLVTTEHFERALKIVRPSVSPQDREQYENLRKRYSTSK